MVDYQIARRARRARNKARAIELLGGVCARCGSKERLEFDHINRDREKQWHCLAQLTDHSWERITQELKKCQLLCKPCHQEKTLAERRATPASASDYVHLRKHGTMSEYNNHKCRCNACRKAWAEYCKPRTRLYRQNHSKI